MNNSKKLSIGWNDLPDYIKNPASSPIPKKVPENFKQANSLLYPFVAKSTEYQSEFSLIYFDSERNAIVASNSHIIVALHQSISATKFYATKATNKFTGDGIKEGQTLSPDNPNIKLLKLWYRAIKDQSKNENIEYNISATKLKTYCEAIINAELSEKKNEIAILKDKDLFDQTFGARDILASINLLMKLGAKTIKLVAFKNHNQISLIHGKHYIAIAQYSKRYKTLYNPDTQLEVDAAYDIKHNKIVDKQYRYHDFLDAQINNQEGLSKSQIDLLSKHGSLKDLVYVHNGNLIKPDEFNTIAFSNTKLKSGTYNPTKRGLVLIRYGDESTKDEKFNSVIDNITNKTHYPPLEFYPHEFKDMFYTLSPCVSKNKYSTNLQNIHFTTKDEKTLTIEATDSFKLLIISTQISCNKNTDFLLNPKNLKHALDHLQTRSEPVKIGKANNGESVLISQGNYSILVPLPRLSHQYPDTLAVLSEKPNKRVVLSADVINKLRNIKKKTGYYYYLLINKQKADFIEINSEDREDQKLLLSVDCRLENIEGNYSTSVYTSKFVIMPVYDKNNEDGLTIVWQQIQNFIDIKHSLNKDFQKDILLFWDNSKADNTIQVEPVKALVPILNPVSGKPSDIKLIQQDIKELESLTELTSEVDDLVVIGKDIAELQTLIQLLSE